MTKYDEFNMGEMVVEEGENLDKIAVIDIKAHIALLFPQPQTVQDVLNAEEPQLVMRVAYETMSGKKFELMYNEHSIKHMMYLAKEFVEARNTMD